jgi:predicted nucleotidyltransferase
VAIPDTQARVAVDAIAALEAAELPYLLVGGVASTLLGRPRSTDDVDIFVRAEDADQALELLARAGFTTERTNPKWIFKAEKHGIAIDLVFWLKGGITVDDEMLARAGEGELAGRRVRVIPPEDLFVIKAISFDEQSNRHWYDALGLLAVRPLDWPYLVRRARHGARRVLSLLVFAQADDLIVPDHAIDALYRAVYGGDGVVDAGAERSLRRTT